VNALRVDTCTCMYSGVSGWVGGDGEGGGGEWVS